MHLVSSGLVMLLLVVATVSYASSVTLGILVATRRLDTRGFHWLHHVLYICTFVLAGATAATAFVAGPRGVGWLLLAPLVAFALIPFLGTRTVRHPLIGSAPAPFYVAAFVLLALT
jgi:hypothetical protein